MLKNSIKGLKVGFGVGLDSMDQWANQRGMNSVAMFYKSTDVDYTAAVLRAIRDKAPGLPLYIPGDIPVSLTGADALTTEDIILVGPGSLVYKPGFEGIYAERPLGAAVSITAINITTTSHILNLATGNTDAMGDRLIKIQPTSVAGFAAGNNIAIFSQDALPMSSQVWTGGTSSIWNKQLFKIKQLGLSYTGGSAFTEGDIVTGAGGATAVVRSAFGTTTGTILFDQITGTFVNGETLSVGGSPKATASGTAFIVVKGKLYYSFLTNPIIRKMSSAKFIMDGVGIKTATDQNAIIGAANRKAAIALFGQSNPLINARMYGMYSKGIQLTSCFEGSGLVRAYSGANNANTSEGAYSYPIEIMGATTGGLWDVRCQYVRHGFSTNTWQMATAGYGATENNYQKMGFPVQTVITGKVRDTWSAGMDQHECAFDMRFTNFEVRNPGNGKRNTTQSVGLQIRGNGTLIDNFYIEGATIGILDGCRTQTTGFAYATEIKHGKITNIGMTGISDVGVPTDGLGTSYYSDIDIECDGLFTNSPWSGNQAGIYIANTAAHEIENVRTKKVRGSHFWFAGAGSVVHSRCKFDHSFAPANDTSSHNIRIDNAAIDTNTLEKSTVIAGPAVGTQQPAAYYRYTATGSGPVLKVREMPRVIGRSTPLPMVVNTHTTPGTATVTVDHGLFSYADDAAAGTAGIPMGGDYLKAGVVTKKIS